MLERIWRKVNTLPLLVGVQTCTAISEISMAVPQVNGIQSTTGSSNSALRHIPKWSTSKDFCSTVFIAALFITARTWKQPRCPSTEERKRKMWYIYTVEFYSVGEGWKLEIRRKMEGTWSNQPEWGNPVTKRGTWYVLTHIWTLDQRKGSPSYNSHCQRK